MLRLKTRRNNSIPGIPQLGASWIVRFTKHYLNYQCKGN